MLKHIKKKVLQFSTKKSLYEYCKEHDLLYDTIAYRVKHNPNKTLEELVDMPNYSSSNNISYKVIYNDKEMSLNKALYLFFRDNKITCSTNTGYFTNKIKAGGNPQKLFDTYCAYKLDKVKRL